MSKQFQASFLLKLEDKLSGGLAKLTKRLEALGKLAKMLEIPGLATADATLKKAANSADTLMRKVNGVGASARSATNDLRRMAQQAIYVNAAGAAFVPPSLKRALSAGLVASVVAGITASGGAGGSGGGLRLPALGAPIGGSSVQQLLGTAPGGGIPLVPLGGLTRGAIALGSIRSAAHGAWAQMQALGHQVQHVNHNMRELGEGALTAFATGFGLMHPISEYAKFENISRHIGITEGYSRGMLPYATQDLMGQFRGLALSSGQSSDKIAEAAQFLITTGIGKANVDRLLPLVAKASTAYNTNIGDSVQAIFSLHENLGVKDADMAGTISAMALAGKEGHFSFSDFSRLMPNVAPLAAAAGLRGSSGARDLMALLETSRRNSGTSGEAETNLRSFLTHLYGDSRTGLGAHFKKFGVDLPNLLVDAEKKHISAPEAVLAQVLKMTSKLRTDTDKNNLIGSLFRTQESATFVRGALADLDYLQKLRAKLREADAGTIDADHLKAFDAPKIRRYGSCQTHHSGIGLAS